MDTQDNAIYHDWIHFIPTSLHLRREKTIWSELESNPGPLASQVTAMAPWAGPLASQATAMAPWAGHLASQATAMAPWASYAGAIVACRRAYHVKMVYL